MMWLFLFLFGLFGFAAAVVVAFYNKFKEPDKIVLSFAIAAVVSIFLVCFFGAIEHHDNFEKSMYGQCD